MTCHNCGTDCKRFGFTRQGFQRHRCNQCKRTFSDVPEKPLDNLRVPLDQAVRVVHLLAEGVGIRAASRLTGLHTHTVLNILKVAGEKCQRLLDSKVRNIQVESVQADELWSFVYCKQANNVDKDPEIGEQYTFLAIDRKSKLIISHLIGKRDYNSALDFLGDLKRRVDGRFQLTTDQFQGYVRAMFEVFGGNIDFAQQQKVYALSPDGSSNMTARRYSPPKVVEVNTMIHIGYPDEKRISTSHVERTNLSVRLFNKRYARLTICYSKKKRNLSLSTTILIAHFNFCRIHSAHGQTPAQAAGLTDHKWTIEELLSNTEV